MNAAGKVFLWVFLVIGIVGFITLMAFVEQNGGPRDAAINTSLEAYYNTSQVVNQSINQSMQYGRSAGAFLAPFPTLALVFVIFAGISVFLIVIRRR